MSCHIERFVPSRKTVDRNVFLPYTPTHHANIIQVYFHVPYFLEEHEREKVRGRSYTLTTHAPTVGVDTLRGPQGKKHRGTRPENGGLILLAVKFSATVAGEILYNV